MNGKGEGKINLDFSYTRIKFVATFYVNKKWPETELGHFLRTFAGHITAGQPTQHTIKTTPKAFG